MKQELIAAVLGPTASGKTSLAVQIAEKLNGEIICMDSTTVYQGFDIGSSKPAAEEISKVPHHLIDILKPDENFSAYHFVELANQKIHEITARKKLPILVGGTYFYLRALQNGMVDVPEISNDVLESIEKEYFEDDHLNTDKMHAQLKVLDPEAATHIHQNDRYRLVRAMAILKTSAGKLSDRKPKKKEPDKRIWMKYAITLSRHHLNQAIINRTDEMLSKGIVEETKRLLEAYPESRGLKSVGYYEAVQFLKKQITEKQLKNEIIEKTRQLAKRQVTWLRSDPEVRYVDFKDIPRIQKEIENMQFVLEQAP